MKKILFIILLATALCVACNKDNVITADLPVITLEDDSNVYTLKYGESLTLTPSVKNADRYTWILDDEVVATTLSYTFRATEVGTFYLTFRAENESGKAEQQLRIEVMELLPPVIGFALDGEGVMTLAANREYTLAPDILNAEEATFDWKINGQSLCSHATYTASFAAGEYDLSLTVTNPDGTATENVTLQVVDRLAGRAYIPTERNVPLGRTLYLAPTLRNFSAPTYAWAVNGVVQSSAEIFAFTPSAEGNYNVTLTLTDTDGYTLSTDIAVTCCAAEGTYKRIPTAESKATWSKVYEYMPAPGQFINEDKSGFDGVTTAAQALAYADKRLTEGKYLSLGGWGGYVVVGFDHSVVSGDDYDFSISGNMFDGSSEAGIVWVMQDTNGNALPDDEWYELRGSEWGSANHSQHYAVTYYRPAAGGMCVQWADNRDAQGRITRNATHTHDYYYPAWIGDLNYTLCGSVLAHNTSVDGSGRYVNNPYEWGYADNRGNDADSSASNGEAMKCYFKISNAVNLDGTPADLQYIDFVKVQSAINHVAGGLGEISTEVMGFEDENM
jgi:PKD repeat protein